MLEAAWPIKTAHAETTDDEVISSPVRQSNYHETELRSIKADYPENTLSRNGKRAFRRLSSLAVELQQFEFNYEKLLRDQEVNNSRIKTLEKRLLTSNNPDISARLAARKLKVTDLEYDIILKEQSVEQLRSRYSRSLNSTRNKLNSGEYTK